MPRIEDCFELFEDRIKAEVLLAYPRRPRQPGAVLGANGAAESEHDRIQIIGQRPQSSDVLTAVQVQKGTYMDLPGRGVDQEGRRRLVLLQDVLHVMKKWSE